MKKLMILGGGLLVLVCTVTLGLLVNEASGDCPPNIHNIQKSWDFENCELTISWDTDIRTYTNYVTWGENCDALNFTSYANNGRHHSTTFDVTGYSDNDKLAFTITSGDPCTLETTSCMSAAISPCLQ